MNERIRELYNQSLEEKYQYGGSDAKPGEMYSNYITVLNPEKFAELIVEEMYDFMCKATDNDGAWPSSKEVKQHFGVEE